MFAFTNGMAPEPLAKTIYDQPLFGKSMKRLQDMDTGRFHPEVGVYKPPLPYLSGLKIEALPTCRYAVDIKTPLAAGVHQVTGWALAPRAPARAGWVLAYSTSGTLIGTTRVDVPRPDLAGAFSLPASEGMGFNIVVNSAESPDPIRLVATLERAGGEGAWGGAKSDALGMD